MADSSIDNHSLVRRLAHLACSIPERESISDRPELVGCGGCGAEFAPSSGDVLEGCLECPECGLALFPLGDGSTCSDIEALWGFFRLMIGHVMLADQRVTWGEKMGLQRLRREIVRRLRPGVDPQTLVPTVDQALAEHSREMSIEYAALMIRKIARRYEFGQMIVADLFEWLQDFAGSDGEVNVREDRVLELAAKGFGIDMK